MLKQLIYNDLFARGKTVAKEWGSVAAEFERICGEKDLYTRSDVISFLVHLRERGLLQSTIVKDLRAIKLLAQIQGWDFPKLSFRRVSPDEIRRTILNKEAVSRAITHGKQVLNDVDLCFLALATTYGLRRIELVRLQPLSLSDGHLTVDTAKGGSKTTHLVPREIAPYLASFRQSGVDCLTHMFHRIADKCGLNTGPGYGWHSYRRSLVTELILSEASALNVIRFMRWSDGSALREFNILALYAQKDQDRIDREIFKVHPFLHLWK